jgi:hypothetical protein
MLKKTMGITLPTVIAAVIVSLFGGVLIYFGLKERAPDYRLHIALGLGLSTFLFVIGTDVIGFIRHRRAVRSTHFKTLIDTLGFEAIQLGDYFGLQGEYKGCFMDVYFDWNVPGPGNTSIAYVVLAYFHPPVKENNKLDPYRVSEINRKYFKWFRWNYRKPEFRFGERRTNMFVYKVGSMGLVPHLDQLIETLKQEKLLPADKASVLMWRAKGVQHITPDVETYPK